MTKAAKATRKASDPLLEWPLQHTPQHLLRRAQQRALDIFHEAVGKDGPTAPQYGVLLAIYQNPGMSQSQLIKLQGIDRSTLAEMIKRLAKQGLLSRSRTSADKRADMLHVTEDGARMLRDKLEACSVAQDRIMAVIPPERRGELMALLYKLAELEPPG